MYLSIQITFESILPIHIYTILHKVHNNKLHLHDNISSPISSSTEPPPQHALPHHLATVTAPPTSPQNHHHLPLAYSLDPKSTVSADSTAFSCNAPRRLTPRYTSITPPPQSRLDRSTDPSIPPRRSESARVNRRATNPQFRSSRIAMAAPSRDVGSGPRVLSQRE